MQKVYQPPASYDSGSLHAAESINPEIDLQRGPDRYCLPLKHARLEFVLLNCLDRLLIEALGIRTKLGSTVSAIDFTKWTSCGFPLMSTTSPMVHVPLIFFLRALSVNSGSTE
jgi:hypothetical protein